MQSTKKARRSGPAPKGLQRRLSLSQGVDMMSNHSLPVIEDHKGDLIEANSTVGNRLALPFEPGNGIGFRHLPVYDPSEKPLLVRRPGDNPREDDVAVIC